MNISVIIPNYNGEELLRKNLPGITEAVDYYSQRSGGKVEIIIVDDGSTDNSVESIKYYVSSIKYKQSFSSNKDIRFKILENKENLGFSSTVNRGVKEAKGDIVVLLNTDVAPEENFLEPLIRHFEDPKIFAIGCLDKSIEGEKVILRGRGIGRWERGFLVHSRGEIDRSDTLWVSGGSGAYRRSIWNKLGGFDPLYNPFYWEDIDLSYRAQKAGYKILFENKSIVIHIHQEGAIKKHYSDFKIRTIAYRNQFIFVWKNITDWDKLASHFIFLPYHFLSALIRLDFPFFLGFMLALRSLPRVIEARARAKMI